MSEKRFELSEYSTVYRYSVIDNIQKGTLKANEIIILLSKQAEKIDEQQATISRLEEENRELRNELSDCEKFRYSIFKRIGELNVERK